jgi:cardiolipin synthase
MNQQIKTSQRVPERVPERVLNLPNFLTILRILAIPIFVTTIIYHEFMAAMIVFIAAAITDALDGLIARMTKQQTDLGRFLDPLADKILLTTSFVLFAFYGWIPIWLAIIVITRDVIVVVGWFVIYLLRDITLTNPSFLGKSAIALQLIFIAYVIIQINFKAMYPALLPDSIMLILVTACFTVLSGLHYIYKGFVYTNG